MINPEGADIGCPERHEATNRIDRAIFRPELRKEHDMAATELFEGSPAHRAGAFFQVVEKAAANVVALWTAYRNRRAVGALLGWDAHMLRDIGLNHSDVESALAVSFNDDPSSRLSSIATERRQATREQVLEILRR
jgi:uncharacterized protein YjiS (DUF1127 family)